MFGPFSSVPARKDHADCSGCSLCLLVCPVWRRTHDLRFTPHGRAKALQHGAGARDIAASIDSCTLCLACVPACPENIDLAGMIVQLRRELHAADTASITPLDATDSVQRASTLLLADASLCAHPQTLARVTALLGSDAALAADDGMDIAEALETGAAISPQRLAQFLDTLRCAKQLVIADGLLLQHLRAWLPRKRMLSLGEALSHHATVRRALGAGDLYVVASRAYHADHARLVKYYDRLRRDTGCDMNLDLQRIAIPAAAQGLDASDDGSQARWLLHGRQPTRIVVESLADAAALASIAACPVVHVAHIVGSKESEV